MGGPPSLRGDVAKTAERPKERSRLYAWIGGDLGRRNQRLMVDNYCVIVALDDGSEKKLLWPFADAVREMDGQDGFLIHRSHWMLADPVACMSLSGGVVYWN